MNQINEYSKGDINRWKNSNIVTMYLNIKNNIAFYEHLNSNYKERFLSVKQMIDNILKTHKINDLEIFINLTDYIFNNPYFLHFSCIPSKDSVTPIPNFSFYGWKDANSDDYFTTKNNILLSNIKWDNKENKILWSGLNTSNIRNKMNIFKDHEFYTYNLIEEYK